jgi:hypothetical protein
VLHAGSGGSEFTGRKLSLACQHHPDRVGQGPEENGVEKDIAIRRNKCTKLGVMGGDVTIAQGGSSNSW